MIIFMKNRFTTTKKIFTLPLVVTTLFFSLNTPKAEALGLAVPSWDGLSILETITQQLADSADEIIQESVRISLDSAAYAAGQALLNQMTENTIAWIRGGYQGSPSFDVNPERLMNDLADSVAGNTARQIRGLALCDFDNTFRNDLANMVELSTRRDAPAKFAAQVQCPFPSTINASDFFRAGARSFEQNGGWDTFERSLSDSGNRFGARVMVSQELIARQDTAQTTQEKKLARSNGFLDIVNTDDCTYPEGQAAFDAIDWSNDPKGKALWQKQYCNTRTPGKVVGDTLTKTLGVDMDKLGLVDSVNKIIGAVINQMISDAKQSLF